MFRGYHPKPSSPEISPISPISPKPYSSEISPISPKPETLNPTHGLVLPVVREEGVKLVPGRGLKSRRCGKGLLCAHRRLRI